MKRCGERIVQYVNMVASCKGKSKQEQSKRELIEIMLENKAYNEEEKAALREELSKMNEK